MTAGSLFRGQPSLGKDRLYAVCFLPPDDGVLFLFFSLVRKLFPTLSTLFFMV